MSRWSVQIGLAALVALLAITACQRERVGPEAQVRTLIQGAIAEAEQKRIGDLRALISEQYRDDQGQDKRAVENLLRLHFLRNERLYLFARVQSITLAPPDRAQAIVLVAMAGVPIASAQDLPVVRADMHRFEIDFAYEDKRWRAIRAAWRRAEAGEFLGLSGISD